MKATEKKGQNPILKGYNMLLYFAGTMIMYEPVEECVVDFWSKGIIKTLPVSSSNPRFLKAASQLRDECKDINLCVMRLQEDYKKLLAGTEIPVAYPVKSSYVINGKESEKVTEFYNSYGWKN